MVIDIGIGIIIGCVIVVFGYIFTMLLIVLTPMPLDWICERIRLYKRNRHRAKLGLSKIKKL